MNEPATSLLVALCGGALGLIFYGGLWLTVRRSVRSERPALLFMGSMALRTALVLGGVWLVAVPSWERMLSLMLGFVIARLVVTRLTAGPAQQKPAEEVSDAPQP